MSQVGFQSTAGTDLETRQPAVAGTFYPADPALLNSRVQAYLEGAQLPQLDGSVRAIIAPHAGYMYSGSVAGCSFRALSPSLEGDHTIFLMGPAHYVPISGVAVGRYQALSTPLGELPVDVEIVERLLADTAIFSARNDAHAPEHCLEVELPFLHKLNSPRLRIVPLLIGQTSPKGVSQSLIPYIENDPSSCVVVSSDLSHFHSYEHAWRIDTALLEAIVRNDYAAVARGEACGRVAILTLMLIAERLGWKAHLLDYKNSGDSAGDRQRVVGYGAVAYTKA